METATTVVSRESSIKTMIMSDVMKKQFALALPRHMKPDRFIRIAITAITRTPKLAECTQTSLMRCLLDLSALGLEPDGRRAHLIPFNDRKTNTVICTLIIDYKGLVELVMNTKEVSNIHADIVCENDEFVYNKGVIEKHLIDFKKPRGDMYAVYCIITMKDGTQKTEAMQKCEIDNTRKRSKAGDMGPWVTDYTEMAKKTVFRRATKWVKLSPEVIEKIYKDYDLPIDITPEEQPAIEMPKAKVAELEETPAADGTIETPEAIAPEDNASLDQRIAAQEEEKKAPAPMGIGADFKLMTAKYNGICKQCGRAIDKNTAVYYSKQAGTFHKECVHVTA